MKTYKCSHADQCKSESCSHAVAHDEKGCATQAPCGIWPGKPYFKPMVVCIEVKEPWNSGCGMAPDGGHECNS